VKNNFFKKIEEFLINDMSYLIVFLKKWYPLARERSLSWAYNHPEDTHQEGQSPSRPRSL
jgi:hypothetical protein